MCKLHLEKQPSAPEGVPPVQSWILTEYIWGMQKYMFEFGDVRTTELSIPTDPQTASNTPENARENIEGQAVSASMPGTISTSSSNVRSEKTSKETNEVAAQSENIGKFNCSILDILIVLNICQDNLMVFFVR